MASREEVHEQVREILVERLDIDEADVTEEAAAAADHRGGERRSSMRALVHEPMNTLSGRIAPIRARFQSHVSKRTLHAGALHRVAFMASGGMRRRSATSVPVTIVLWTLGLPAPSRQNVRT